MRRVLPLIAGVGLAWLAVPAAAQSAKRPIVLDDLSKVRAVGDPQRSPEGQWVAYTVGTTDAEKDERDTDIWMTRWDGSEHIRLTSSPDSESRPRWSPDGKYLAFLTSRGDEDEKKKGAQVWLLNRAGGEAQKLTDVKGGVSDFAWSPDAKRLALVVNDPDPNDDPEKKEGWKRKTKPPVVIDRYHFKQDREGYLERLYAHLALFDVAAKKLDVLTTGQVDDSDPAWSPDGTTIAFRSKRAHKDPDRTQNADLYVIDARAGAQPRALTVTSEDERGRPAWSPDGQQVAVLVGDVDKYYAYDLDKLALVPASGGAPRLLTAPLDRPVSAPVWTADGRALVFGVDDDRASYIGRVPAAGGTIEKLATGRRVVSNPTVARGDEGIAVLAATPGELPEVYALEKGQLRRLSTQNDALLAELQLATVEDFTSKSKDGTVVNGLLTKPAAYQAGKRYPTLLYIHGGPNGQDDYAFNFDREFFAAHGYVVLEINYRGSSGRGEAFQKAIFADWGNKEVVDLLGAVDEAVRMGIADPDRLGLGGWSYGGILTNYTIATDPRFKAAVSGASSSMQFSMYGLDQYIVQYEQEMGLPWKAKDAWMKVSYPFFNADRIRTPTLFLCGEKDFNVPIAGVEQMYQALRSLDVPTQLVIYPGQFHGLTVPSYQRDRLQRFLDWWNKYLQPGAAPTAQ
jgi:dipeptidyl aminopeptidase/acylaminoacyl peptidase